MQPEKFIVGPDRHTVCSCFQKSCELCVQT